MPFGFIDLDFGCCLWTLTTLAFDHRKLCILTIFHFIYSHYRQRKLLFCSVFTFHIWSHHQRGKERYALKEPSQDVQTVKIPFYFGATLDLQNIPCKNTKLSSEQLVACKTVLKCCLLSELTFIDLVLSFDLPLEFLLQKSVVGVVNS